MKSFLVSAAFAASAQAAVRFVVFEDGAEFEPQSFEEEMGIQVSNTYNIANSFRALKVDMDDDKKNEVEALEYIKYVEEDAEFTTFPALPQEQPEEPEEEEEEEASATEPSAVSSWGLDRVDQRDLPLDDTYSAFGRQGEGVTAYVIDTSCEVDHPDLEGRASFGFDGTGSDAEDKVGHGSHVAGTIAGTRFGVAPRANVVCIKVCATNSCSLDAILSGVEWAAEQAAGTKAVANMSLGGRANRAIDDAVSAAISSGLPIAVASGNSQADSCTFSPARVPTAVTVDASDVNDRAASFTNKGTCSDLFAPGVDIKSSWIGGGDRTISGTSMASPHVAGVMALYLAEGDYTPEELSAVIVSSATPGKVQNVGSSPNLLAFNQPEEFDGPTPPTPTDGPEPTPTDTPCEGICCVFPGLPGCP